MDVGARHAAFAGKVMRRRTLLTGVGALGGAAGLLRLVEQPRRDGPLFVRRAGDRGPSLLCLHGLFASGAFWQWFADDLARDFRLVMPDLVGFGHSPQPEADYTIDFHLRWLEPVLAEASSWVVIGHSMGTILAAELARRRPEIVDQVILFNAPVYASAEHRVNIFGRQNLLTRLSMWSEVAAHLVCEIAVCTPRPLLTRIAPWLRRDVPPQAASDYFRHTYTSYSTSLRHVVIEPDLLEVLGTVRRPVLVVQGAADDIVEPADRLQWPANVHLQVVPGADHTSLFLHDPAPAAPIVRTFVDPAARPADRTAGPSGPL
jgi:pimeloyl-ACP methyl ester carboxylesterase